MTSLSFDQDPSPALGFHSDNVAGASPRILQALLECNAGQAYPYGGDALSAQLKRQLSDIFEHELDVLLVPTGTSANALSLAAMTPPWGAVLCHADSHINNDECGAPEFYMHGAKLLTVGGKSAKMEADLLANTALVNRGDVHMVQPTSVSITQATEVGSLYSLDEIRAIGEVCQARGLRLHMDGARFANALVALGCSPAEMTWKAGVQALSFGATKNGTLTADAIVVFDTQLTAELAFRRKRAGHLSSKMRFMSAQMSAYLQDDLWLDNARQANAMAQRLVTGLRAIPGVEIMDPVQANILFCRFPQSVIDGLLAAGFGFYHGRWAPGVVRLVTAWSTREQDVDHLLTHIRALSV